MRARARVTAQQVPKPQAERNSYRGTDFEANMEADSETDKEGHERHLGTELLTRAPLA